MFPIDDCFLPRRRSMADFVELSREAVCQEALQRFDKVVPYDILGWGGDDVDPLPPCLKAMDTVLGNENME